MLSPVVDIFRLRQYFDVITRTRQWVEGVHEDSRLLSDVRRAMVPLPFDHPFATVLRPFPAPEPFDVADMGPRRLAVMATGGSGALASVVGVARALEEAGVRPAVLSLCSGSAMFGFPIAAGVPAEEVAEFFLTMSPQDYIDVDWGKLLTLIPNGARGFAGLMVGDRMQTTCERLVGHMTLQEMPIAAYAPIWNIEENGVEYLGPRTYPAMTVARAMHMAIALPLFVSPVELDGGFWCDGGIVDIFPVNPLLDLEETPEFTLAVNGFYPPGFAGEDATGWENRRGSILYVASQVRTCQQAELARVNLARIRRRSTVVMIEPVPYGKVKGVGFYRQFLNTQEWPQFMSDGRLEARRVLSQLGAQLDGAAAVSLSA
jgi:NTE family protein